MAFSEKLNFNLNSNTVQKIMQVVQLSSWVRNSKSYLTHWSDFIFEFSRAQSLGSNLLKFRFCKEATKIRKKNSTWFLTYLVSARLNGRFHQICVAFLANCNFIFMKSHACWSFCILMVTRDFYKQRWINLKPGHVFPSETKSNIKILLQIMYR